MPKMKTHSGSKKRFRRSGTGIKGAFDNEGDAEPSDK